MTRLERTTCEIVVGRFLLWGGELARTSASSPATTVHPVSWHIYSVEGKFGRDPANRINRVVVLREHKFLVQLDKIDPVERNADLRWTRESSRDIALQNRGRHDLRRKHCFRHVGVRGARRVVAHFAQSSPHIFGEFLVGLDISEREILALDRY